MSPGLSAVLWLLIPVSAPIAAWIYFVRRAKADPNANIEAGVNELNSFRAALAATNPAKTIADPATPDEPAK
jgi:hypothetical protein